MRTIRFRFEAREEFIESCRFYEERDPQLRLRFEAAIDAKLSSILENHELYPVVDGEVREATIERFPFTIYFRVTDTAIRVMSLFHQSRDPSVWQSRVPDA